MTNYLPCISHQVAISVLLCVISMTYSSVLDPVEEALGNTFIQNLPAADPNTEPSAMKQVIQCTAEHFHHRFHSSLGQFCCKFTKLIEFVAKTVNIITQSIVCHCLYLSLKQYLDRSRLIQIWYKTSCI